ncbi:hypothetical protein ACH4FV_36945 [Streptomyces anulatus]|nr:hypothetical protein OG499_00105 [Streptomyces anulatus]
MAVETAQLDVALGGQQVGLVGAHVGEQVGGEGIGRDNGLTLVGGEGG